MAISGMCSGRSWSSISRGDPCNAESPQADIVTIGSILEHVQCIGGTWTDYRGIIWGAGRMDAYSALRFEHAKVLALRGHWTRKHVSFSAGFGQFGLPMPLLLFRGLQSAKSRRRA